MAPLIKIIWAQQITPSCLVEPIGLYSASDSCIQCVSEHTRLSLNNTIPVDCLYIGLYMARDLDKLSLEPLYRVDTYLSVIPLTPLVFAGFAAYAWGYIKDKINKKRTRANLFYDTGLRVSIMIT